MIGLSDAAVTRLRALGRWPELESGRYTIVEEIGRGGMGTVYLAVDEELGARSRSRCRNAVGPQAAPPERRLQTEARVLARLEHPGIVPIHDTGRLADGRALLRDEAGARTDAARSAPRRARPDRATARLRTHLRAGRVRTRRRVHPSRPQARQRHGRLVRRSHGDGLGGGQDCRQSAVGSRQSVGQSQSAVRSRQSQSTVRVGSSQSTVGGQSRSRRATATVIGTVGFMAPEQARGDGGEIDQRARRLRPGRDPLPAAHRRRPRRLRSAAKLRAARCSAAAGSHLRACAGCRALEPLSER